MGKGAYVRGYIRNMSGMFQWLYSHFRLRGSSELEIKDSDVRVITDRGCESFVKKTTGVRLMRRSSMSAGLCSYRLCTRFYRSIRIDEVY